MQKGVSYSFGTKQEVSDFSKTVEPASTGCYAPKSVPLGKNETLTLHYKIGLLSTASDIVKDVVKTPGIDSDSKGKNATNNGSSCVKAAGKRYPGVESVERGSFQKGLEKEYYTSKTGALTGLTDRWDMSRFNPSTWAGIDCAGFVQRMWMGVGLDSWAINSGIKPSVPKLKEPPLANGELDGGLGSQEFNCASACPTPTDLNNNPMPANLSGRVYQIQIKQLPLMRRGDLIFYDKAEGIDHISTMYSDRAICSGEKCDYEIVHAYGNDGYKDKYNVLHFTRKVLNMPAQLTNGKGKQIMPNVSSFGRIKLWD